MVVTCLLASIFGALSINASDITDDRVFIFPLTLYRLELLVVPRTCN
jgi:hypothetical protein